MWDVTRRAEPEAVGGAGGVLRDLIAREGGSISFEQFMEVALLDPRFGYYSRRVSAIGREGDFATSATLHHALGTALAAWAEQRCGTLGWRGDWHLIELGGGSGQMADDILRALGWWARRRVRYHIVERSETLRDEQRTRLARWPMVAWHSEMDDAVLAAGGRALIVSNEFVDAFPCLRLERAANGRDWHEIRVSWHEQSSAETVSPWKNLEEHPGGVTSTLFDAAAAFAPGQRIEWHRSYFHWLKRWLPKWGAGCLLTVDYGDLLPGLYHRRPGGTLRAYHRHIRYVGKEIYARAGWQDLTADVNFSDLLLWGKVLNLENVDLCIQGEFLRRWLPASALRRFASDPAWRFLQDEAGAGSAFKVLEQRR